MISMIPILINIDNMNEETAKSITNIFITKFGGTKHSDVNSFFKDLQPICRSMKCKPRFVDGASIEINDESEGKYTLTVTTLSKEKISFNCILALNKGDDSLYIVNALYLFVPSESVDRTRSCTVDVSMEKGGNDDGSESADDREPGVE